MPRTTPHTEETKRKISEATQGRTFSEEAREKMSKASKGRKKSKAHREAMKAAWARRRLRTQEEHFKNEERSIYFSEYLEKGEKR